MKQKIKLNSLSKSWAKHLAPEFEKPYMQKLGNFLQERENSGGVIFPTEDNYFNALNLTPLEDIKVVIIGQDPYHGVGQAHGLCFSVETDVKIPPSLKNIYKEIMADIGCSNFEHGNLEVWAKQGVLLLNSVLTVEEGKAGAHAKKGWEKFTDKIIEIVNDETKNTVFLLWGSYAHKKGVHINTKKHLVLKSTHPSPLSAYRGFFGCRCFSGANNYLTKHDKKNIDWCLKC